VETDFAGDSSGFMTTCYERWFDHKYGTPKNKQEWVNHGSPPARKDAQGCVIVNGKLVNVSCGLWPSFS
jgi:hypothetical protein